MEKPNLVYRKESLADWAKLQVKDENVLFALKEQKSSAVLVLSGIMFILGILFMAYKSLFHFSGIQFIMGLFMVVLFFAVGALLISAAFNDPEWYIITESCFLIAVKGKKIQKIPWNNVTGLRAGIPRQGKAILFDYTPDKSDQDDEYTIYLNVQNPKYILSLLRQYATKAQVISYLN